MLGIAGDNKKDLYPRHGYLDKGLAYDVHRPRPGSIDRIDGLGVSHFSGRLLLPFISGYCMVFAADLSSFLRSARSSAPSSLARIRRQSLRETSTLCSELVVNVF